MLKILQITNKLPFPPKDGGAIAALNMAKGLSRSGAEVSLLSFNTSKHYQDISLIDQTTLPYKNLWVVDLDSSLNYLSAFFYLFFSKKPYHLKRFWSEAFKAKLIQVLSQHHFDIIQIESLYLLHYLPIIRNNTKTPVAYRAHNIEHEIWLRNSENETNSAKRLLIKLFAKRIHNFEYDCINTFDFLLAISPKDLAFFSKNGLSKPNFVASVGISVLPLSIKTNAKDIFYIGALDWMPNQEGLIWFLNECWEEVRDLSNGLSFHIAGRNAPNWLVQLIEKKQGIVFHGEVEDASAFMQAHGVLVVPLFSGSGMRVKIAEGMSLGKAIVTTKLGLEGIDAENDSEILLAETKDDWIKKIRLICSDADFREKIETNATEFAKNNLSLEQISLKIVEFYKTNTI